MLEISQLSDNFEEPFEILDIILKKESIDLVQVEQLTKRFKESYLTIEKKDNFYDTL